MNTINSTITFKKKSLENSAAFKRISLKISDLGASVGIKIVPFHQPDLIDFSNLNEFNQQKVLTALNTYFDIYQSVKSEGASIMNSSRVLWGALLQLGYRPTSDMFSHIRDEHIIEIHDCNLIQVFRNLSFFKYCSYSLEELYCHHLTELYERDTQLEKDLIQLSPLLFSGQIRNIFDPNLKPHVIQEKMSPDKLAVLCHIERIAPLFANADPGSNPIAALTIEKAEIVQTTQHPTNVIQLSSRGADATEFQL